MPMVNLRMSDEEVSIMDYVISESNFDSRKVFFYNHVYSVACNMVGLPDDLGLSEKQILKLLEAREIDKYEFIRKTGGEEQFKLIINESDRFKDVEDYERQRNFIKGEESDILGGGK